MMTNLKDIRISRGIKSIDLARQMGIDKSTISNLERGNYKMPYSLAPKIAKALGCSVEELLGQELFSSKFAITDFYNALMSLIGKYQGSIKGWDDPAMAIDDDTSEKDAKELYRKQSEQELSSPEAKKSFALACLIDTITEDYRNITVDEIYEMKSLISDYLEKKCIPSRDFSDLYRKDPADGTPKK